jgi:hypothetical protein
MVPGLMTAVRCPGATCYAASNWFSRAIRGGGSRWFDPTVGNKSDLLLCDSRLVQPARRPNSAPGCAAVHDIAPAPIL